MREIGLFVAVGLLASASVTALVPTRHGSWFHTIAAGFVFPALVLITVWAMRYLGYRRLSFSAPVVLLSVLQWPIAIGVSFAFAIFWANLFGPSGNPRVFWLFYAPGMLAFTTISIVIAKQLSKVRLLNPAALLYFVQLLGLMAVALRTVDNFDTGVLEWVAYNPFRILVWIVILSTSVWYGFVFSKPEVKTEQPQA